MVSMLLQGCVDPFDEFADGSSVLGDEYDTTVLEVGVFTLDEREKVIVEREYRPVSFGSVPEMFFVSVPQGLFFDGSCHILAMTTNAFCDRHPDVLVSVDHAGDAVSLSMSSNCSRNSSM